MQETVIAFDLLIIINIRTILVRLPYVECMVAKRMLLLNACVFVENYRSTMERFHVCTCSAWCALYGVFAAKTEVNTYHPDARYAFYYKNNLKLSIFKFSIFIF